jgi:hypothetical protein
MIRHPLKHRVAEQEIGALLCAKDQLKGNHGVRLLLLDFLVFCFVYPAQALLNSTPQLLARDRRVVAQGAQLGPGDLRMDTAASGAVKPGG